MIAIDATPMQTEHRFRGPSTYTAGLLDALACMPHPVPIGLVLQSPHPDDLPLAADLATRGDIITIRLNRPRRPRYHLRWIVSRLAVGRVVRRARPRIYHATEPDGLVLVPGVVTVATLYDLIPLRQPSAHFPLRRLTSALATGATCAGCSHLEDWRPAWPATRSGNTCVCGAPAPPRR